VSGVFTVARREWRAAFESPVAYVLLGLVPALAAAFFFVVGPFFDERTASLRAFFGFMPQLLIVVAPATTMRLWSEERRSGTEELLLAWPFRLSEVVLGKFLGAWGILLLVLLFTLGVPLTVAALGPLDWGPVAGGYLATALLGAACVAVGLFLSALTRNQIVAWLLAVAVLLLFNLLGLAATSAAMPPALGRILLGLDFGERFQAILRGVVALKDVAFFLWMTLLLLALNGLALERRRWSP